MLSDINPFLINKYLKKIKDNFLINLFFRLALEVIYSVIFCLFKIFNIKFLPIPLEALGHQLVDLECFVYEFKKKKLNFKPLIVISKNFIANEYYFKNYQIENFNIIVIKNDLLALIFRSLRNRLKITYDTSKYQETLNDPAKEFVIFKKNNFFLKKLKKNNIEDAENILLSKKINLNKRFVILHVRDNSFKPFDGEKYRSSEISNFKESVKWLNKNNIQVIRIGNKGMKKSFKSKNFCDLTTKILSKTERQILDIYLIAKCEFFIGTASGPYLLASIFNKPLITIDTAPLSSVFPLARKNSLTIPKLYYDNEKKKYLKFREILRFNLCDLRFDFQWKKFNLKPRMTSSKEILDAVKELNKKNNNKSFNVHKLQQKFKNEFDVNRHYSGKSIGNISQSFINKYKNLLN